MGSSIEPYKSHKMKFAAPVLGAGLVFSVITILPVLFVFILGIIGGAILAAPSKMFQA